MRLTPSSTSALVALLLAPLAALHAADPPDTNYDESKVPSYTLPEALVCFDGQAVEDAVTGSLFAAPRHPYTRRLISSTPGPAGSISSLAPVPGNLPDLRRTDLPACRFAERCERADERCRRIRPLLGESQAREASHRVACWYPDAADAAGADPVLAGREG